MVNPIRMTMYGKTLELVVTTGLNLPVRFVKPANASTSTYQKIRVAFNAETRAVALMAVLDREHSSIRAMIHGLAL